MPNKPDLRKHYALCGFYLLLIISYVMFVHLATGDYRALQEESQRTLVRSIFYVITIVLFPLTNLLRFILLRLNQTMPGTRTAAQRYFTTVCVTQSLLHSVAVFGLIMFLLGDGLNTFYIFSVLGCLAVFLHRPRDSEYASIEQALSHPDSST